MSSIIKGVKKVFSKVAKVVSKVLPVALAIGAVYFTAGAALGIPGTAGGWGGAVSSLTSKLGATGVLGNVLTGAITQAGYGAALGGGMSLITGGDALSGTQMGAAVGGATGAVTGGLGFETDPLKGIGGGSTGQTATLPSQTGQNIGPISSKGLPPVGLDDAAIQSGVNEGLWAAPVSGPVAAAAPATAGGGMLNPNSSWLEKNQTLVGTAAGGLGSGLLAMGQGGDRVDAAKLSADQERERRAAIAANYSTGKVPGFTAAARPTAQPTPAQRFDPVNYNGTYQYDPASGRIVFVNA